MTTTGTDICTVSWGTSDDVVARDRHHNKVVTTISLHHVCGQRVGNHPIKNGHEIHICKKCTATFRKDLNWNG